MPNSRLFRFALCVACLGSSACATTSYSRGEVRTLPSGVKGKAGGNAHLELAGLRLHLEALDYASKNAAIPPLALRLRFDPRELGYSFDPAQVRLRDEGGATWSPVDCVPGYQTVGADSSFGLRFDVKLLPDAPLELELGGLARGTKRIDPVRLVLARRTGRTIDRVYWLEPIGYALAVFTYPMGGM